jgi:hypothetical protein
VAAAPGAAGRLSLGDYVTGRGATERRRRAFMLAML